MQLSTGLRVALLESLGIVPAMGDFHLRIYSGTTPVTADDSIGSAVLLVDITNNGSSTTLLNFESTFDWFLPFPLFLSWAMLLSSNFPIKFSFSKINGFKIIKQR